MSRTAKVKEHSYALDRAYSSLWKRGDSTEGSVYTPLGIVSVHSQYGECPFTVMYFVAGGRRVTRSTPRAFTVRSLVMLANRFATEATRKRGRQ